MTKIKNITNCLITLFCPLIFLTLSAFMFFSAGKELLSIKRTSNWIERPAQVSFEREHIQGKEIITDASYSYQFKSLSYKKNLSEEADFKCTFDSLEKIVNTKQDNQENINCLVNPNNPKMSLLRADSWLNLTETLLIALILGLVGISLLKLSIYVLQNKSKEEKLKNQFPEEPWRYKINWQDGKIVTKYKKIILHSRLIAMIVLILTFPIIKNDGFFGENEFGINLFSFLFLFMFSIIVFALIKTIKDLQNYSKIGEYYLNLKTFPAIVGESIQGAFQTSKSFTPENDLIFKLKCFKFIRKNQSAIIETSPELKNPIWEDKQVVNKSEIGDISKAGAEFHFSIPSDCLENSNKTFKNIVWVLEVYSGDKKSELITRFELPVYHKR